MNLLWLVKMVSRQFLDRQFLDWVRDRDRVRVRVRVRVSRLGLGSGLGLGLGSGLGLGLGLGLEWRSRNWRVQELSCNLLKYYYC